MGKSIQNSTFLILEHLVKSWNWSWKNCWKKWSKNTFFILKMRPYKVFVKHLLPNFRIIATPNKRFLPRILYNPLHLTALFSQKSYASLISATWIMKTLDQCSYARMLLMGLQDSVLSDIMGASLGKIRIFSSLKRGIQHFRDRITKHFYCKKGVIWNWITSI